MIRLRAASAFLLASMTAGCELAEVSAPASADVLVVESVLRVGAERQYVLLHRSLDGRRVVGEPDASVSILTPDGRSIQFVESELTACVVGDPSGWNVGAVSIDASCYASPEEAGYFVQPGETYELTVETIRGEIARARTTVPGDYEYRIPEVAVDPITREASCALPSEPFHLTWSQSDGAWSYVISLQLRNWGRELREQGVEVPTTLELTGVSVSAADTSLLFPENLGVFQRGDLDRRLLLALQQGLPAEANAVLVVLAADRNYTNAIRGGRFNPSGNVRVSSVVGDGVGLFGSLVPLTIRSRTSGQGSGPPPC